MNFVSNQLSVSICLMLDAWWEAYLNKIGPSFAVWYWLWLKILLQLQWSILYNNRIYDTVLRSNKKLILHTDWFLVACSRLYNPLCWWVGRHLLFKVFFAFFGVCIPAPAQMLELACFLTAPAHLHVTLIAVYPTLLITQIECKKITERCLN